MSLRNMMRQFGQHLTLRRCATAAVLLVGIGSAAVCLVSTSRPLNRHYTHQLDRWLDVWIEDGIITISVAESRCPPDPSCLDFATSVAATRYGAVWVTHLGQCPDRNRCLAIGNSLAPAVSIPPTTPVPEIEWAIRERILAAVGRDLSERSWWIGLSDAANFGAVIRFPLWIVPLLALMWLLGSLARQWLARRRRRGRKLCRTCGYHLRGNTSGICPECGTRTNQWARAVRPDKVQVSGPRREGG